MGVLFLALTTELRYQYVLDYAATTIDFNETGLPALSLDGMGGRVATGSLTFEESNNPLFRSRLLLWGNRRRLYLPC